MKKHLHKFESTLWLFIKSVFYILLLAAFIIVQRHENIGLRRLSRTMGITVFTFTIVGLLLLTVYGAYDVGRRKSKPIIYSMTLAVICTDIVTYLQVMIMRANTNIHEFRFRGLELLPITVLVQLVIIIIFVYAGNALFFLIHEPEKCCVITSSQKSLDVIAYAIGRFRKQYQITSVLDHRSGIDQIEARIKDSETVFMYDVPAEKRLLIMRLCYKYKTNVYFNPYLEDIMEINATHYILDDVYGYFPVSGARDHYVPALDHRRAGREVLRRRPGILQTGTRHDPRQTLLCVQAPDDA